MEIFGIGPGELFLILLVAFIVLGPERLPAVARSLGAWVRQLRSLSAEFTSQLQLELADATQELRAAQAELGEIAGEFSDQMQGALADAAQNWPASARTAPSRPNLRSGEDEERYRAVGKDPARYRDGQKTNWRACTADDEKLETRKDAQP